VINPGLLLTDLKRLLEQLEGDLRERADEVPTVGESLRSAHDRAKQAERTAQPFETWREEYLTQVAAAWILACVFVRFIEDNGLIDTPLLAGPGPRLDQAKDQRTLYFQQHPTDSDREYLYYVFREVEALPAAAPLLEKRHNPLWMFGVSGDGATLLIEFWQRIDPGTGALAHDFADPALNTRFLGDLYQDLSEAARKKYALLQTPEFVEEFILDRTLTPAIAEFGLAEVRLIDPACGSGHFLLGAFRRALHEWQRREPAVNVRELAQRALDAVSGVDLNPYAVAIARFRLLIAALRASDIHRLADSPAFHMNLAIGDSLLHGPKPGGERQMYLEGETDPLRHVYDTEDADELRRILGTQYQVVVGNPPYITVKDRALSDAYRQRFGSCYRQYSLAVPFMERCFDLAITPADAEREPAGYVGMITANSFMKREFGKRLIEEFIPRWDVTHVIDTSGAYIPGHGTPTVILFGRHRRPLSDTVRAVLGIRGEPATPEDPSRGLVWSAIVDQIDRPGSQSGFISVTDMPRLAFQSHPWSIGGGGAAELKQLLDSKAVRSLESVVEAISAMCKTRQDDAYIMEDGCLARHRIPERYRIVGVEGDRVRDWRIVDPRSALFPYDSDLQPVSYDEAPLVHQFLWPYKEILWRRKELGGDHRELGKTWWEWNRFLVHRYRTPLSVSFAFVATHNHFVLDRGGKVFNGSAPVIKLPAEASEQDHLALLGVLNSSTACFWMKQTFHNKGSTVDERGARQRTTPFEDFYEFAGTGLLGFPIPPECSTSLAGELDRLAATLCESAPAAVAEKAESRSRAALTASLMVGRIEEQRVIARMVMLQEELDWQTYHAYGLTVESLTCTSSKAEALGIAAGQRAFEIVMARRMSSGDLETAWFERHGSTPVTDCPAEWPTEYAEIVRKRIALIERDPNVALIEQPEFKRRWNIEPWELRRARALREWLLRRLEMPETWSAGEVTSVSKLGDRVRRDAEFMQVAELYRGRADFDVTALVAELTGSEAVPFLPVLRYRATGIRKRALWEHTWELQRRADAEAYVGEIPVPPNYSPADFSESAYWSLRGKLDVPKERFISYPHAERDSDQTMVIGWAGWDRLEQAKALAGYYVRMKEQEGWAPARLEPLLAGLLELIPWLKQWHNDLDPAYGIGMGDYFAGFVDEEARALGFTLDDVRAWQPPAGNTRRRRRASV
jgi:hypothetical protein